jgi:hypothetical protein
LASIRAPTVRERVSRETVLFYYLAADQVFLDDALQHFWCGGVIPDAFGVDDGDGPAFADTEAVGLGAIHVVEESQFSQAAFQVVPGFDAHLSRAALRIGLLGTQEDMVLNGGDAQAGSELG